ncbi:MAG: hypothetical protein GY751_17570 [Bacteroidetes bacterium]|nr:hypothetical protein [Bacteroidota bacterium]
MAIDEVLTQIDVILFVALFSFVIVIVIIDEYLFLKDRKNNSRDKKFRIGIGFYKPKNEKFAKLYMICIGILLTYFIARIVGSALGIY